MVSERKERRRAEPGSMMVLLETSALLPNTAATFRKTVATKLKCESSPEICYNDLSLSANRPKKVDRSKFEFESYSKIRCNDSPSSTCAKP